MPRRVLLTGAAGFVGAAMARRLLAEGHRLSLVVRPAADTWRIDQLREQAEVVELDLRASEDVAAAVTRCEPEWVFHLATHGGYSWQREPVAILETNLVGSANVIEAAAGVGAIVVQAGSSSEYGLCDRAPAEDTLPRPNGAYAVGKLAATVYGQWVSRQRLGAVTTLRLYSVYGPWEQPGRLIPTLVAHCLRGELPPLADPRVARDFVYVEDVCDALIAAAERATAGEAAVYNIGSGRQTTLEDLVRVACGTFGLNSRPSWGTYPSRSWDTEHWEANPGRAARELGWQPLWSLEDGLTATAQWLDAGSHAIRYA